MLPLNLYLTHLSIGLIVLTRVFCPSWFARCLKWRRLVAIFVILTSAQPFLLTFNRLICAFAICDRVFVCYNADLTTDGRRLAGFCAFSRSFVCMCGVYCLTQFRFRRAVTHMSSLNAYNTRQTFKIAY